MRIAYFLTHPIQYQSPLIRHLRAGGVDVHVVYGNDATARTYFDKGFGKQFSWDVPLLEGYPSTVLNTEDPKGLPKLQRAHFEDQIAAVLEEEKFDAVWVHGWAHPFTQAAWLQASQRQLPILLRGETFLGCVSGGHLRRLAHKFIFSRKFREVSAFLAVGKLNAELYRAYGVETQRIFRVPYVVDNEFFQKRCREAAVRREKLRAELGIELGRPVVLFCAKLIAVKDPATLIRAVGMAKEVRPMLLLAGDGEMRPEMEKLADEVAPGLVKFLGFRNQTELPSFYDLCDLMVLPSVFEPWGLVVNEVMNAGRPVIVSDKIGSGYDLVRPGLNGDVFRAGDVTDLHAKLLPWLQNAGLRASGGQESLRIIQQWGFDENLAGLKQAMALL